MVKVADLDTKEDNDELYNDADYIVNEKAKTATLTPSGVKKAEAYFNVENLTDADNITLAAPHQPGDQSARRDDARHRLCGQRRRSHHCR